MAGIIALYDKLIINRVSYEAGDYVVTADCDVIMNNKERLQTKLRISHTDLNRIIAKIIAAGEEFLAENVGSCTMEDGTEIIDYSFENVIGRSVVLQDFQFVNEIREIRA